MQPMTDTADVLTRASSWPTTPLPPPTTTPTTTTVNPSHQF